MDREGVRILRKTASGFTLVELLVVIAILIILGAVVLLVINPFEFQRRGRDATRISDLANLQTALNLAIQEGTGTSASILCVGTTAPCSGASNAAGASTRNVDGSGYIKVNLSSANSASFPILPADPINDASHNYRYYSDGNTWEVDAVLESAQYASKASTDGGDCATRYEVGTSLTLQQC